MKPHNLRAHVSWSFRDEKNQDDAYANHKSALKWPKSPHNAMKEGRPCARALDLFEINEDGQAEFSPKFYYEINRQNELSGEPLQWGGKWKTLGDADHFELRKELE